KIPKMLVGCLRRAQQQQAKGNALQNQDLYILSGHLPIGIASGQLAGRTLSRIPLRVLAR
ncbi:MAG: hypothetical protein SNJ68_09360, partial [Cyanobacteriota bacterium]